MVLATGRWQQGVLGGRAVAELKYVHITSKIDSGIGVDRRVNNFCFVGTSVTVPSQDNRKRDNMFVGFVFKKFLLCNVHVK